MNLHYQMIHCELEVNSKLLCFYTLWENNGFSDQELAEVIGITCEKILIEKVLNWNPEVSLLKVSYRMTKTKE